MHTPCDNELRVYYPKLPPNYLHTTPNFSLNIYIQQFLVSNVA